MTTVQYHGKVYYVIRSAALRYTKTPNGNVLWKDLEYSPVWKPSVMTTDMLNTLIADGIVAEVSQ